MADLSTGVDQLDRAFGGNGFPSGFVISFNIPPSSNGERMIQQFMSSNPDMNVVYITTQQSEEVIKTLFQRTGMLEELSQIQVLDFSSDKNVLDEMSDFLRKLPDNCMVVVDSVDVLESEEKDRYQEFLNSLTVKTANTDSVTLLVGSNTEQQPKNRPLTLKLSDVVCDIDIKKDSGEVVTLFTIMKFRGIDDVGEQYRLNINETSVSIDTSRDIA